MRSVRVFAPQPNVNDFCKFVSEIFGDVDCQMMDWRKLDNPVSSHFKLIYTFLCSLLDWVFYSACPVRLELEFLLCFYWRVVEGHVWSVFEPGKTIYNFLNLNMKTYSRNLDGWVSSSPPMMIIPFNFILPVNGTLNSNSSSTSLSTNWNLFI